MTVSKYHMQTDRQFWNHGISKRILPFKIQPPFCYYHNTFSVRCASEEVNRLIRVQCSSSQVQVELYVLYEVQGQPCLSRGVFASLSAGTCCIK